MFLFLFLHQSLIQGVWDGTFFDIQAKKDTDTQKKMPPSLRTNKDIHTFWSHYFQGILQQTKTIQKTQLHVERSSHLSAGDGMGMWHEMPPPAFWSFCHCSCYRVRGKSMAHSQEVCCKAPLDVTVDVHTSHQSQENKWLLAYVSALRWLRAQINLS